MKSELLEERDSRWLTSHTAEQRKIEVRSSGGLLAVQVAPACKVHQLLHAELKFADFGCPLRGHRHVATSRKGMLVCVHGRHHCDCSCRVCGRSGSH